MPVRSGRALCAKASCPGDPLKELSQLSRTEEEQGKVAAYEGMSAFFDARP
jgi:hypothetical protein